MKSILFATLGLGLAIAPAFAVDGTPPGVAKPNFLAIDGDNGDVYYNGRNSGRYCVYKTVERFNRSTGYMEPHRVRSCGRGLYVR